MANKDNQITMETMNNSPSSHDVEAPSKYDPWADFVDNTTLHGLRYVFRKKIPVLRLVWFLILIATTSFYTFLVYKDISKYLAYPISTVLEQKYVTRIKFPAVTICSQNMLQRSKVLMPDSSPDFKRLGLNMNACEATVAVRAGRPCGHALLCCCGLMIKEEMISLTIPNCSIQYRMHLRQALKKSNILLNTREFVRLYGPEKWQILGPSCSFNSFTGDTCTAQDFSSFRIIGARKCFTFNSGESNDIRSVDKPGGLNVIIDAQIPEYTTGKMSQGFQVFVHGQQEYINPLSGILVGPGSHVFIAVSKQKFINLPAPYSTKCKDNKLKMFPVYTIDGCLHECELTLVEKVCGCISTSYSGPLPLRYCTTGDYDCRRRVLHLRSDETCNCPVPCTSIRYNTQVSYSSGFPDPWVSELLKEKGYNQTSEYQRTNLVFVQVAFKSLSYELQEQVAAFETGALLGEIGGSMGLFVGCSLITLVEFMDFLLIYFYQKIRNPVTQR